MRAEYCINCGKKLYKRPRCVSCGTDAAEYVFELSPVILPEVQEEPVQIEEQVIEETPVISEPAVQEKELEPKEITETEESVIDEIPEAETAKEEHTEEETEPVSEEPAETTVQNEEQVIEETPVISEPAGQVEEPETPVTEEVPEEEIQTAEPEPVPEETKPEEITETKPVIEEIPETEPATEAETITEAAEETVIPEPVQVIEEAPAEIIEEPANIEPEPAVQKLPDFLVCPMCGKRLVKEAHFCMYCGCDLSKFIYEEPEPVKEEPVQAEEYTECAKCGEKYPSRYPRCPYCGTSRNEEIVRTVPEPAEKEPENTPEEGITCPNCNSLIIGGNVCRVCGYDLTVKEKKPEIQLVLEHSEPDPIPVEEVKPVEEPASVPVEEPKPVKKPEPVAVPAEKPQPKRVRCKACRQIIMSTDTVCPLCGASQTDAVQAAPEPAPVKKPVIIEEEPAVDVAPEAGEKDMVRFGIAAGLWVVLTILYFVM